MNQLVTTDWLDKNIEKVKNYCRAEEYHQKYIEKKSR
mgnify:CR=1 FL=1